MSRASVLNRLMRLYAVPLSIITHRTLICVINAFPADPVIRVFQTPRELEI